MKIYVMADMEGMSGIYSWEQCLSAKPLFGEGRAAMTCDVNACVAGLFEGGATEVIVRDQHAGGSSLLLADADPRAAYVRGRCRGGRMPGLDGCAGLVLLGYHAMAGTPGACLAHSFNSNVQNMWLNGRPAGEIAIDAGMAGDAGVPCFLVTGDDAACREAQAVMPDILAVPVKRGLGPEAACLMHPAAAQTRIRERAREAVGRAGSMSPFRVPGPVVIRQEFTTGYRPANPGQKPFLTVLDERTYEVTGSSVSEAYFRL